MYRYIDIIQKERERERERYRYRVKAENFQWIFKVQ